jgi:hypothetical protein
VVTTREVTLEPVAEGPRRWLADHGPFLVALLVGAALRVVVELAFPPALIHADGPTYLAFLKTFEPDPYHPAGYGLLVLYPLSLLTANVAAVAVAQHLMGLAVAVVAYALLRRWGVGRWLAMLATLPVVFDSLQLILEQTVLSDTLFELLLVLAVAALGWTRRPSVPTALIAGLMLGGAVVVRLVGEPLVLVAAGFCLLAADRWQAKLRTAVVLVLGFALPIGAYATWYHAEHGVFALSQFGGKALYIRTTSFVDCSKLSVPHYQRVLCPREPLGQRSDPTYYGWQDPRTIPRLIPPSGTSRNDAMHQFAVAAIHQQPTDYVRVVLRDVALNFDLWRTNRFEYWGASSWRFSHYPLRRPKERVLLAYAEHGGEQLTAREPYADALVTYQRVGYLPGPLLLGCLLLAVLGSVGVGRSRHAGKRSICMLLTATAIVLLVVPAITAGFSWRYQLPALALLPAGAALALTALRDGPQSSAEPGR